MPKFTRSLIDALEARPADYYVWDSELSRFGVKVTPKGRKVYICRYRTLGRANRKQVIGRTVDMTPDQARAIARRIFGSAAEGKDPSETAEARTVQQLRDRYMTDYAKVHKKASSIRNDDGLWRNHILPAFGTKAVAEVTREHVADLHASIKQAGSLHTANRVRALLSKAFNLAIDHWKWLPADRANPCRGVKKFKERKRQRPIRPEEMEALGKALDELGRGRPDLWRGVAMMRLWLYTGARMNEIQTARWDWIDRVNAVLVLPDSKTNEKLVNLPPAAMEVINGLPSLGRSLFLFPGNRHQSPMKNPRKTVAKVLSVASISGLRIHDLRHVFGSIAHRTGANLRQVADLLGHQQLSTAERYTHGIGTDVQAAAETASDAIREMLNAHRRTNRATAGSGRERRSGRGLRPAHTARSRGVAMGRPG
jgi:integrase